MERDNPKPPIEAGFLLNLALFAAALCLWGPLLLFALVWMSRGDQGAYFFAVVLFQVGFYACPAGALVVALYAAVVRPWRRPAAKAWFFWMQVLAVAVIGMAAGAFALNDWQDRRQHAAEQRAADEASAQERQMDVALRHDDVATFAHHYQACGEYCARQRWIRKAVAAEAPGILASLLKDAAPASPALPWGEAENDGICKDGAYYEGYLSIAALAGAKGNRAIIDQLLPLWNREQVQQAFDGAAMGNQVATMQMLLQHGADPQRKRREDTVTGEPVDDAMTFATSTGAADALRWLAEHGARPDGETTLLWATFNDWVEHSPAEVWTGRLDAVLDALGKLGVEPTHNGSQPLWPAIDAGNARLIHELVRRGARPADVEDSDRQAQLQALLAGPADALGRADGQKVQSCERGDDE